MKDGCITPLSWDSVSVVADALASAELVLRRFHGARVRMDGQAASLDHSAEIDRLQRARQLLDLLDSQEFRRQLVMALECAGTALALGNELAILADGPPWQGEVDFGDAPVRVSRALRVLGLDPRYPRPGTYRYRDHSGGAPEVVQVRDADGELFAVFRMLDAAATEIPVSELDGDFELIR